MSGFSDRMSASYQQAMQNARIEVRNRIRAARCMQALSAEKAKRGEYSAHDARVWLDGHLKGRVADALLEYRRWQRYYRETL